MSCDTHHPSIQVCTFRNARRPLWVLGRGLFELEWQCLESVCEYAYMRYSGQGWWTWRGRHIYGHPSYKPSRKVASINASNSSFPTVTSDGTITFLPWIKATAGSLRLTATSALIPSCIRKKKKERLSPQKRVVKHYNGSTRTKWQEALYRRWYNVYVYCIYKALQW